MTKLSKSLYHTTTIDRADSIMRDGFRDNATVNKRLSGTIAYEPGVWFSDVPAIDDDMFDGIGLFSFDAERQAFIAVDMHLDEITQLLCGIQSSTHDDTWPGTQYWGPAWAWNELPRTRIALDDIIKLRLATDPKLRPIRQWVERCDPRPYGTEFHARVKRLINQKSNHGRATQ